VIRAILAILALFFGVIGGAVADTLEVRKDSNLYAEPNRNSTIVKRIDLESGAGPYLVTLVDDKTTNGYYHVKLRGRTETAWIYRTYVRRFKAAHPKQIPYKRALYRHWIDEDKNCRDTRTEVLARDARSVEFSQDGCNVLGGVWDDPYTGKVFRNPKELDIDHLVPLKNAHESGAWAWLPERRREYANYLNYEKHLLAVNASENRKKGDKGPDRYLPPDQSFHCTYIQAWVEVKRDWELEMTQDEDETVRSIQDRCR